MSKNVQRKTLPTWYREFRTLFRAGAGHCFILCGDVHGVTSLQGASQLRFMQGILHTNTRDIIAYYHRAIGITFALPSMRAAALDILGPNWSMPSSEEDMLTAALDASGIASTQVQGDAFSTARRPRQALTVLEALLRSANGRVAVIIDGADLICPATSKASMTEDRLSLLATLKYWGNDVSLGQQNNPVFLLSPQLNELHPDLRISDSGYKVVELSLPDEHTRLSYITWYLDDHRESEPIPLIDLSKEDLARSTAGLNLRQIEDILLLGAIVDEEQLEDGVEGNRTSNAVGVTRLLVKSRKDAIIRQQYSGLAVLLDPLSEGFAGLGGMDQLVTWTQAEVIAPLREGRQRDVPKGILLAGPPGTGKTRFVEAAAKELGYNAILLRMSNILGGVVGTSEQNLQAIFDLVLALAPTFMFIDEIDQSLGQRGHNSGSPVAGNLFGALLQFMGDERLRGQVIVVAATNHPERLDDALKRSGRFDVIFPVLCPDEAARRSMLDVQARIQKTLLSSDALSFIAKETNRFSAADLEAVVKESRLIAWAAGRESILLSDAQSALDNIRPATLASVDAFTRQAIDACNNLRYLPPDIATQERNRRQTQIQVAEALNSHSEVRSSRTL